MASNLLATILLDKYQPNLGGRVGVDGVHLLLERQGTG